MTLFGVSTLMKKNNLELFVWGNNRLKKPHCGQTTIKTLKIIKSLNNHAYVTSLIDAKWHCLKELSH